MRGFLRAASLSVAAAGLAAVGLAAAGCTDRYTRSAAWTVHLGAGGRAEGRMAVPAGTWVGIVLRNQGPGSGDFVFRTERGEVFRAEAIGNPVRVDVTPAADETLVLELRAAADAPTDVVVALGAHTLFELQWDLSRAARPDGP